MEQGGNIKDLISEGLASLSSALEGSQRDRLREYKVSLSEITDQLGSSFQDALDTVVVSAERVRRSNDSDPISKRGTSRFQDAMDGYARLEAHILDSAREGQISGVNPDDIDSVIQELGKAASQLSATGRGDEIAGLNPDDLGRYLNSINEQTQKGAARVMVDAIGDSLNAMVQAKKSIGLKDGGSYDGIGDIDPASATVEQLHNLDDLNTAIGIEYALTKRIADVRAEMLQTGDNSLQLGIDRSELEEELNVLLGDNLAIKEQVLKSAGNIIRFGELELEHQRGYNDVLRSQTGLWDDKVNKAEAFAQKLKHADAYIKGTAKSMLGLLTPTVLLGTAALFVVSQLGEQDRMLTSIRKTYGKIGEEAMRLRDITRDLAISAGVSLDYIQDAMQSGIREFGSMALVSQDDVKWASKFQKYIGISSDDAMSLLGNIQKMTDPSATLSEDLGNTAKAIADAHAVPLPALLNDVANVSERVLVHFRGSTEELLNAAANARKLGMNLDQVAGIADNMLDFESSIESEIEASMFLGRSLDLNSARQAAFNGDMNQLQVEVGKLVEQMGGLESIQNMNSIQQTKFAAAIGMSANELLTMARNQKAVNAQLDARNDLIADGNSEMLAMLKTGATMEEIMGDSNLFSESSLSAIESFDATVKTLGITIVDSFGPLINMGNRLLGVVSDLVGTKGFKKLVGVLADTLPWILGLTLGLKASRGALGLVAGGVKLWKSGLGGLATMLGKVTGVTKLFASTTRSAAAASKAMAAADVLPDGASGRVSGSLGKMSKINFRKLLMGSGAVLALAGSLFVFAKAVKEFQDILSKDGGFEAIGTAFGSLVVIGGLAFAASKLFASATPQFLLGAVGVAALGAALIPAAYGIKQFTDIEWGALGRAAVTLAAIGVGFAALGAAALPIAAGAAAIGAAALAVWGIGKAVGALTTETEDIDQTIRRIIRSGSAIDDVAAKYQRAIAPVRELTTELQKLSVTMLSSSLSMGIPLVTSILSSVTGDPAPTLVGSPSESPTLNLTAAAESQVRETRERTTHSTAQSHVSEVDVAPLVAEIRRGNEALIGQLSRVKLVADGRELGELVFENMPHQSSTR